MYTQRIAHIEQQAREQVVLRTLWYIRQAPLSRQPTLLTERLEQCDRQTREAVYQALTDDELVGLCGPGSQEYLSGLSDAEIATIATDRSGHEVEQGYRHYQRWQRSK